MILRSLLLTGSMLIIFAISNANVREAFTHISDPEVIKDIILSAGMWGPFVYLLMQITQVIIAPLPGSVMAMAAGYIYGAPWATFLTMIGSTIGFWLLFMIAKRFGRPLATKFVDHKKLEAYEKVVTAKGSIFLYAAFLIPVLPDPLVGLAAGLTPISMKKLLIIAVIARLPGVFVAAYIGSQAAAANYTVVGILLGLVVILCALIAVFKKQIERVLFHHNHKN